MIYREGDVVKTGVRGISKEAVGMTGADGLVYFGDMYLGKYIVKETSTPQGIVEDATEYTATLSYKNDSTPVVRADEGRIVSSDSRQKVNISVNRKEADNTAIEGSIVGLYAKDDIVTENGEVILRRGSLIETQQTNKQGIARFSSDLPHGWYYVKELIPAYGHQVYEKSIDVDMSANADSSFNYHKTVTMQ